MHITPLVGRYWGPRRFRLIGRLKDYCKALGIKLGLRWYCARALARLPFRRAQRIVIKPPDLFHPVTVRMNPSSDEYVFIQLFVHREYAPVCPHLKDPKVIFDLGANVGYASAFFASRYPNARILAVEPDPENFKVCEQNLKPYGNRIRTLRGAVWSRRSRLALSYRYGDGWATKVMTPESESDADVDAWDMTALMDMFGVETVDLLKIDIEGSEAELFAANTAPWLRRARNICIELHDEECRQIFFKAISEFDYGLNKSSEFTMCLNLHARTQATNESSGSSVISARSFR